MQLFSIGLYALNNNGTRIFDTSGNYLKTYTNDDISEYARVWTGFVGQEQRGNIEETSTRKYGTANFFVGRVKIQTNQWILLTIFFLFQAKIASIQ